MDDDVNNDIALDNINWRAITIDLYYRLLPGEFLEKHPKRELKYDKFPAQLHLKQDVT